MMSSRAGLSSSYKMQHQNHEQKKWEQGHDYIEREKGWERGGREGGEGGRRRIIINVYKDLVVVGLAMDTIFTDIIGIAW